MAGPGFFSIPKDDISGTNKTALNAARSNILDFIPKAAPKNIKAYELALETKAEESVRKQELAAQKILKEKLRKIPVFFKVPTNKPTEAPTNKPTANLFSTPGPNLFSVPRPAPKAAAISRKDLLNKLAEVPTPDLENIHRPKL